MNKNYSVLKSFPAEIGNKLVNVQQLLGRRHKQDIAYRIDGGNVISTDKFFNQKPKFKN